MTNLLFKNKITLGVFLSVLLEALPIVITTVELPETIKRLVQIFLIVVPIAIKRHEEEQKKQRSGMRLAVEMKFSFLKMFRTIYDNLVSDIFGKSEKDENNISHILLGGSVFMLIASIMNSPNIILLILFSAPLGYMLGVLIELVQKKFFEGTPNDKDVRMTFYGTIIFGFSYWILSIWYVPTFYVKWITTAALIVLAFALHRKNLANG